MCLLAICMSSLEKCLLGWASLVAQMVKRLSAMQETRLDPWVGKIPWRRKWQPTPIPLPGKSHGWRILVGYNPWGRKELDTTEQHHFCFFPLFDWVVFLVLSCMSCLYILEINPLSVVSFAVFSHSESFLFTLLIVSFAVQKLLSLIRSHLFTFVFISITLGGGS